MEDKRISVVRAKELYVGRLNGHLGTRVMEKDLIDRYTLETFESDPVTSGKAGGAATGATGDENVMNFGSNAFEYHMLGAGQTILAPSLVATGLLVTLDQINDEGIEITQGILARSKMAFVVGTDSFFFKLNFTIADVTGTDDCAVGFRSAEAYDAAIATYNDSAVLNMISGNITIETVVGGAGAVVTDTLDNWVDTETHTLAVFVDKGGVVTYEIDGAAPTTIAAYTFVDGATLIPFFYFLHAAVAPGDVIFHSWECGLQ